MLLNSVVIVLREALEAALMISILLALSRILDMRVRWVAVALVLGLLSAALYGSSLSTISDLFDGVGQEVTNATMQYLVFALLVYCLYRLSRNGQAGTVTLTVAMALAVMLAIAREGSEILVYVSGFLHSEDFFTSVAIGSTIGAIIGISVGVLFYYLLLALPPGRALPTAGAAPPRRCGCLGRGPGTCGRMATRWSSMPRRLALTARRSRPLAREASRASPCSMRPTRATALRRR